MVLTKQGIDISFAQGLDTKTDPKRLQIGRFERLENTVFNKGGLLQKRNGYGQITSLPTAEYSYLTTFSDNLTAVGPHIAAYNSPGKKWVSKGNIDPLSLKTLPVIRNNLNQTQCDTVIAPNGTACAVYLETDGTTTVAKYVVFDSVTGQNLSAPAAIPVASGTVTGGMRVFYLGTNFVLVFTNVITAVSHLQYVTVSANDPAVIGSNTDIASSYVSAATLSWDGSVINGNLYLAYNTTSGGQAVKVTYLTTGLILATAKSFAGNVATMMSVTGDVSNPAVPVVVVSFYDSSSQNGYTVALDQNLNTVMAPALILSGAAYSNLTAVGNNGIATVFIEEPLNYTFDTGLPTHRILSLTVQFSTSVVSSAVTAVRSVGLASKAFISNDTIYVLAAYSGNAYQPSYFLVNGSSLSSAPIIAARLAYQNGAGYLGTGLPSVTVMNDNVASMPYLFKDLVQAVNKNTNVPAGNQIAGIYSQTGINLAFFTFGTASIDTAEIGTNLNISGGLLWMYDGYLPVEHNFLLYPDADLANPGDMSVWSATGGSMAAKPDTLTNTNAYFYQITYEWTDNQGNAFKSAPGIPVAVTTTGSGTAGSVTLHVPTLRLTMKTANPVKIVIYRWSAGQQVYYQVTSVTSPLLNSTISDEVTFVDTSSDAAILGNNILYTTGGVIENTAPPASNVLSIFDTRLWLVDAEDPNLLLFSKQVIEATPVEMSDLLSLYVPPTVAAATGKIEAIHPLDDKLIISKGGNSLVYINGAGPDNSGANNQYSPPVFITSTVGCNNQRSWVLTPDGLMFQSNKGIWLLGRDLSTSYIGAAVENLTTGAMVLSAVSVPETNQVRFTLDTGVTLMYDYYFQQWGSFTGVPALSSCIYQDLHTYINSSSSAFQETPGAYLDGSRPVTMAFKTGPLRLGDLQNYQRAYFFYLLGTYLSPHKLYLTLYYDYSSMPSQAVLVTPDNFSTPYGSGASQSPYGQGTPYGGPGNLENWRVFLERQRCMAVAIGLQEVFDPTLGVAAGAGLTLSGLNVVCAFKKAFRPQAAANSAG